jgi:CHAD domain-containing protein
MALTIPLSTNISAKSVGFDTWMDRTIERMGCVQPDWDADDVHDLRVALRRCRSMAEALSEVNPGPGWRKLKRESRQLFHALGSLRDVQVERARVKKLSPPGDLLRKQLLRFLSAEERKLRAKADDSIDQFDRKEWKKLARKLTPKARFFPLGSVVFQRLALARLNEAVELHRQAKERRSSAAWHRLRIGLKNFRYLVENFLPERYEAWSADLKWMQDFLGEVHDLDVLRNDIRKHAARLNPQIASQWLEKIDRERKQLLQEFAAKSAGPESPWLTWRAGFHWGHTLIAAPMAIRRTA